MNDREFERVFEGLTSIPGHVSLICEGVSQAVDEVVDPVRSGRWSVKELEQPEKTVIGIRVENVLRVALKLPRARKLDVVIQGTNVDIKFTIGENWTIPPEAVGELCLLTRFNIRTTEVSAGLLRTLDSVLNPGRNRDSKRTITKTNHEVIRWLVYEEKPQQSLVGFLSTIDQDTRALITDPTVGAQERVNRLFSRYKYRPIPERVVEAVAIGHVDWERRLRPDAQNRKAPEKLGFEVLRQSSYRDRAKIQELGLDPLPKGFCIAVEPEP